MKMTLNEFIAMGGYGQYVWSAYVICFVVLLLNVVQPILREHKTLRNLRKRFKRNQSQ